MVNRKSQDGINSLRKRKRNRDLYDMGGRHSGVGAVGRWIMDDYGRGVGAMVLEAGVGNLKALIQET